MDSPTADGGGGQLLHSLNAVVNFLHTEGFYAAEETLLREIENRYPAPDATSPRRLSASPTSSGSAQAERRRSQAAATTSSGSGGAAGGSGSRGAGGAAPTVDFQPALAAAAAAAQSPFMPADSMDSAEKVLEAWRSKSTTPAASPKKAAPLSPPASPAGAPKPWSSPAGSRDRRGSGGGGGGDEYEGEDDPGYLRLDVVGQEAALGFELDQVSEASGAYQPLQQYGSQQYSEERFAAYAAHARHSSIDLGLLNRQLHGGASAASSRSGRAPAQQQQPAAQQHQQQQPAQGGAQTGAGGSGGAEPGAGPRQPEPRQPGSPGSGSDGGGSSCVSGERAGSAAKLPPGGHQRSSSYARRQAGTAQWVFDKANSAGADAYRSLLHHLDRPSPQPQPPDAVPEAQRAQRAQQAQQAQPGPPTGGSRGSPPAPAAAGADGSGGGEGGGEGCCEGGSPLFHQESISRVSSLGESMLQEAAALCLGDAQQQQQQQQQQQGAERAQAPSPPPPQQQEEQGSGCLEEAGERAAARSEAEPQLPLRAESAEQAHGAGSTRGGKPGGLQRRGGPPLPSLRTGGGQRGQDGAPPLQDSRSAADGQAKRHGEHGGGTSDGGPLIDYSDPFSFPVTPSSEVPPPPDPAPLFGSWASFKSSPDRKSGAWGGYGTEDESTPARRRYQQAAAAAAVAAAKEAGGAVPQRGSKFPPLGPAGLGGAGLRGHGGSASQLLGYGGVAAQADEDQLGASSNFDQDYFDSKYEVLHLKVVHRRHCTGFEQERELALHIDDLIAGRYQIVDLLGQAAFSRAVQALDLRTGALVCLKIIKNNKDYFDQGLDEVKLLRYVNAADPGDEAGILRLHDFFYFKEHLVLVTELLRANLYEFQKYNRESGDELYFTLPRIQSVARQVLSSLAFLHSLGLVHADLKPENILIKSYSRCAVKVIDLGSSCFLTDHLSSYVQSRSYRAPEVILGLPYDQKVDCWSLGCILAELATGKVLFQNESVATLLARLEGILGPMPRWMLHRGRYVHKYYVRDGRIFEKNMHTGRYEFLRPKATSLARRVPQADDGMLSFLAHLLQVDPTKRPTAREALQHPWLQCEYC